MVGPQTTRNGVVAIDPHTTRSDVTWDHILARTNDDMSRFGMMPLAATFAEDRHSTSQERLDQAAICLEAGASLVLVEAAERVEHGRSDRALVHAITRGLNSEHVMLELPGPEFLILVDCIVWFQEPK